MGVKKYQDWRSRLAKEIKNRETLKFEYGKHDCCFFACACIKAQTGIDIINESFGKYKGEKEADTLLKKEGGILAIAKKICTLYGFEEISIKRVTAGDIVLFNNGGLYTLGVVNLSGRGYLVPNLDIGYFEYPVNTALKAWKI